MKSIIMGRWLPKYGQMVEEKETSCRMCSNNNALVLLTNLQNIIYTYLKENMRVTSGLRRDPLGRIR